MTHSSVSSLNFLFRTTMFRFQMFSGRVNAANDTVMPNDDSRDLKYFLISEDN
jgi:hypothetical protein